MGTGKFNSVHKPATSIASRGCGNTPSRFMVQKQETHACLMGHLDVCRLFVCLIIL